MRILIIWEFYEYTVNKKLLDWNIKSCGCLQSEKTLWFWKIYLERNTYTENFHSKKYPIGFPFMAQWKQIWWASVRKQVWPLASLSRLRIWHGHELWCRSQMQLGSGIAVAVAWASGYSPIRPLACKLPYAVGVAPKRQKNYKKRKRKITLQIREKLPFRNEKGPFNYN